MYAAPFNDDINEVVLNKENVIQKKRTANNRTQKRHYNSGSTNAQKASEETSDRVMNVLKTIQNLPDDDNASMGDFAPLPPPESAGVQATIARNAKSHSDTHSPYDDLEKASSNNVQQSMSSSLEGYRAMNNTDYYTRYIPNYEQMYNKEGVPYNVPSTSAYATSGQASMKTTQSQNDLLMEKLNYMIHLLEEQQDEKTGSVTEEVILYSFLGIFIIFLADTFTRVNKYTR